MKSSAKRLDDSYLTRNDEDGKLFRFLHSVENQRPLHFCPFRRADACVQ